MSEATVGNVQSGATCEWHSEIYENIAKGGSKVRPTDNSHAVSPPSATGIPIPVRVHTSACRTVLKEPWQT